MSMKTICKGLSLLRKMGREFLTARRDFGFSFAWYGFLWWFCFYFRMPLSNRLSTFAMRRKTAWLDRYMARNYADILERYRNAPPAPEPVTDHRIWVFWGQGESEMPPLIRACYGQLTRFNENVTLVTSRNVGEYISLSPVIFEKVRKGVISWAHFSDIVRNALLARYGGLWLDATVWVPGPLPLEKLLNMPLFTAAGTAAAAPSSICFWTSLQWSWSGWCLWAKDKNYLLFSFVSEMLQKIAEQEKSTPDYVIIDYLIYYACRNFPSVAKDMENCRTLPCDHRNDLASMMNRPYDEDAYRRLTASDFVFKLSFRTSWTPCIDGRRTFYGKILSDVI